MIDPISKLFLNILGDRLSGKWSHLIYKFLLTPSSLIDKVRCESILARASEQTQARRFNDYCVNGESMTHKRMKRKVERKKRRRKSRLSFTIESRVERATASAITTDTAIDDWIKNNIRSGNKHSHTYLLSVTLDFIDDRRSRMHKRMMSICH